MFAFNCLFISFFVILYVPVIARAPIEAAVIPQAAHVHIPALSAIASPIYSYPKEQT